MARLFEYQSKKLLLEKKVEIPRGKICYSPEEVEHFVRELGSDVVIKVQVWFTGRAAVGGIQFATSPEEAKTHAKNILGRSFRDFVVDRVLVEEKLNIVKEMFASIIIDDAARAPVLVFSDKGGSGIEEIAEKNPGSVAKTSIDVRFGLREFEAVNLLRKLDIESRHHLKIAKTLVNLVETAKRFEARSVEINPLVVTAQDKIVAADCRITIDDYAVFRHPELEISYARELDNPPSQLDILAYDVEKNDYRGTFYFIQMERGYGKGQGFVGFHGAGGGGSMMSMDAVQRQGFTLANFCDTSGNPPGSKVYRAAKIILSQKNIDGYFGSGSGVASQEQVHSARGLAKAFLESKLDIPAVIRLGGNMEEKAVELLQTYTKDLPAPIEGYTKDDSADFCAQRLHELITSHKPGGKSPAKKSGLTKIDYEFDTLTGKVQFDYTHCVECDSKICVEACPVQILKTENDLPVLAITEEEAKKGKCIECLACELDCGFKGSSSCYVNLPIEGLEEAAEASI